MAVFPKFKNTLPRFKSLFQQWRFCQTYVEGGVEPDLLAELGRQTMVASGRADISKWKKVDSRTLGLTPSLISDSSRIVVRILQNEGHGAYLVGGCVRDLLLHKTPKDFDVVTTANLQEIKKKFHRAFIVGRRFPICRVLVKGSVIEVSSFETVARNANKSRDVRSFDMPEGYDEKDLLRWKNSLRRDFTINSLFYDPFAHKVYDYSGGMADLTSMKLRTLVPAQLSFQEDCARILRGLRIAGRLGLSFAKDTAKAICNLHVSVTSLDKARLMMEMNYMLSYGAAEPSLLLLKRFNLLEVLLPFQAAYLINHNGARTHVMLMKLFFNLDTLVSCDQPCDSTLWVSLLAFHLALVNNPQDPLVVWTYCSVLYHGEWRKSVKVARVLAEQQVHFMPEILDSSRDMSDEELAENVANLASIVRDSIDALTNSESLKKVMEHYPSSPCSGLVFISKNAANEAAKVLHVVKNDTKSLNYDSHYYGINYKLLKKGDIVETRFVLGKIIMNTMRGGVTHNHTKLVTQDNGHVTGSKPNADQVAVEKPTSTVSKGKRGSNTPNQEHKKSRKKQKNNSPRSALQSELVTKKAAIFLHCQNISKKKQNLKKIGVRDQGDAKLATKEQTEGHPKEMEKTIKQEKKKTEFLEKTSKSTKQHKPEKEEMSVQKPPQGTKTKKLSTIFK